MRAPAPRFFLWDIGSLSWSPSDAVAQCTFPRARYRHWYDECSFVGFPNQIGGVPLAHRYVVIQIGTDADPAEVPPFESPFSMWLDVVEEGFRGVWITPNQDEYTVRWVRNTGDDSEPYGAVWLGVKRQIGADLDPIKFTALPLVCPKAAGPVFIIPYRWLIEIEGFPGRFWEVLAGLQPVGFDTDTDGIPGSKPTSV